MFLYIMQKVFMKMNLIQKLVALTFFGFFTAHGMESSLALSPNCPNPLAIENEIARITGHLCIDSATENRQMRISYDCGTCTVDIVYFASLPTEFSDDEKKLFKNIGGHYVYSSHLGTQRSYERLTNLTELKAARLGSETKRDMRCTDQKPAAMTLDECARIIKGKHIIFVTGAGISASVIPSQQALEHACGISNSEKPVDDFVHLCLNSPEIIGQHINEFFEKFVQAQPTPAHDALTQLAQAKNTHIITSNFDLLHEKAGIVPYKAKQVERAQYERDWSPEFIATVDAVVCIGSREDFMDLLTRYKKYNSAGMIIAINREQPYYLGSGDFLVSGDIQELLPKLAKTIAG